MARQAWPRRRVVNAVCLARWALVMGGVLAVSEPANAGSAYMPRPGPLDPRGEIHIPIGIANTLDTLKTFVEAEGSFSPGFATCGIYFWLYDPAAQKLTAPTMDGVKCERGLVPPGYLIPWSRWQAGEIGVESHVCQVRQDSPAGPVFVVASLVQVTNNSGRAVTCSLYAALRPLGPAGGPVKRLSVSARGDALLADGHAALVACQKPAAAGVCATDEAGRFALKGGIPPDQESASAQGDCSGALRFDLEIAPGRTQTLKFICPVLAGRRAVGHRWDGTSQWAQFDLAQPNPDEGGVLQPDPGLDYFRRLQPDALFSAAHAYWKGLAGRAAIRCPDPRWGECFAAIIGHSALTMNEGAPDVAVVNYNVFNRDGVYMANIFQKAGCFELAAAAIDYFLKRPFNGRVAVEADNPGQVLWIMGQHFLFTREGEWLRRAYPAAAKLAAMIRYCRTTPGPHYVKADSLEFGEALPPDDPDAPPAQRRQALKPGSCDGRHPEYTEAFDVAGLRAAAALARAADKPAEAAAWEGLAAELMDSYDKTFGRQLRRGYGSYAVLWPCALYPFSQGSAWQQFKDVGGKQPEGWRYFPLAAAHQGLLAGNRAAGHATLGAHLDHEQMRGWYAFDEGGRSGHGGWRFARTNWPARNAMPHGWAIAEMWLLLRDCLVFEDGEKLVLLAGVPEAWFTGDKPIEVTNLQTHFGPLSFKYERERDGATLRLTGQAAPPEGFALRLPGSVAARVEADGRAVARQGNGEFILAERTREVKLIFDR